jgi:hypothetical protein
MKISSIFLAVSVAISPVTAYAGGSMAPEVRVIVVKPSRTIRSLNEAYELRRQAERTRRAVERAEERQLQRLERDRERADAAADKAYARKLKCQRSVCKN